MIKNSTLVFLLIFLQHSSIAQQLINSNLPIIRIDTEGAFIWDEPKVPALMEVFDNPNNERNSLTVDDPQFKGLIGIELRGQSSQSLFPKKGYGIEIRHEDGTDLDTSMLGMPKESDWVIHSPYSDKSLIRNALAYQLAAQLMPYAPRTRMAELVLNGEYLGVVLWTEKIKRGKNRVDVSKLKPDENDGDDITGGYILKFDKGEGNEIGWESSYSPISILNKRTRFLYHYPKPDEISDQQKDYVRGFIDQFEDVLMSENYTDPIVGYEAYIDVESFVSTVIINELTRNVDGYRLSTYMYKDKDSNGGKLTMGPTWDHNLSWGNANYCSGSSITGWGYQFNLICPEDYWVNHVWWDRLMGDEQFRQKVKDRWSDLRQGPLSTIQIFSRIDSLVNLLREAAPRNFSKWPILGQYIWPNQFVGQDYFDEIAYLKDWITKRTNWLDDNFENLTTAVERIENVEEIKIYPNPTTGIVYLEGSENLTVVEFYTMTGRLIQRQVINQRTTSIDMSSSNYEGLVWYRVFKNDGQMITGKINITRL